LRFRTSLASNIGATVTRRTKTRDLLSQELKAEIV